MIIISPTELRTEQKRFFELAEKERVMVKNKNNIIELVVRKRTITDDDVKNSLSIKDVKRLVHEHIDEKFV